MRSRLEIGIERHSKPRGFEKCVDSMHSDLTRSDCVTFVEESECGGAHTYEQNVFVLFGVYICEHNMFYYLVYTHACRMHSIISVIRCTNMRAECVLFHNVLYSVHSALNTGWMHYRASIPSHEQNAFTPCKGRTCSTSTHIQESECGVHACGCMHSNMTHQYMNIMHSLRLRAECVQQLTVESMSRYTCIYTESKHI